MSTLKINTLSNVAGTQSTAVENAINGSAKAWVNFNGTGTVAIRQAYNVSSITDNGTGDYTLNFTTAFADADYAAVYGCNSGNSYNANNYSSASYLAGSLRVYAYTPSAAADIERIQVAIFR